MKYINESASGGKSRSFFMPVVLAFSDAKYQSAKIFSSKIFLRIKERRDFI
ncbi:hypothetical protein J7I91_24370 [Pseudomonas sp. ISL-84]|nr:hypothetical protein [Pseudomonas sp. ISL-84]